MTNDFIASQQALGERLEAMDKAIEEWGAMVISKMLRQLAKMGLHNRLVLIKATEKKKRPSLMKSLKTRLKRKDGQLDRISIAFIQHGIFFEHGVGKGRPKGSSGAKPNLWIKPILDPAIEQLADIIAEGYADLAVEELKINIPGIISTKVKIG